MPTLDVVTTPDRIAGDLPPVAVVIDVLRATTTIAAILDAGGRGVRAVGEVDEAQRLKAGNPSVVLAGERGGMPPEGFDRGNSPLEMTPERVGGRVVVLTTSNGTRGIDRARSAEACVTLSLTNLDAVAAWLDRDGRDTLVVCSGTDGGRSDEDELCAGILVDRMRAWDRTRGAEDAMERAMGSIGAAGGVEAAVRRSFHAKRLIEYGYGGDVAFCSRVGVTRTVPRLDRASGLIVAG